jgi:hypothetical protein
MLDLSLNNVQELLGGALSWRNLKCRVNALYKQIDGSVAVIAHIPGRGLSEVHMTQYVSNSFCDDVELFQLEREGIEYKAVFVLKPEALAGETG